MITNEYLIIRVSYSGIFPEHILANGIVMIKQQREVET